MSTLEAQFALIHHHRKFDQETQNYVLGLLQHNPLSVFSLQARCQMLGILKSCILANEAGRSGLAAYATAIPDVEKRHGGTLTHIFNLQVSTRFSPAVEQRLNSRLETIVQKLSDNADLKNWAGLSVYERLGLLDDIKNLYAAVHGLKAFKIGMTAFNPNEKHGEASNGLQRPVHEPDIRIGHHVVEQSTPDLALEVLYHECTHIYFGQLARYAHRINAREHALSPDATLAYYRAVYGSYCPSSITPAYNNDSEEMLATSKGRHFAARMKYEMANT